MSNNRNIKAGDIIECEGALFADFSPGDKVEVREDERGLYIEAFQGTRLRLHEVFSFTKDLTGDAYAMCHGFAFIKRGTSDG